MRAPKVAMLIMCLALWGGQALAQSPPPLPQSSQPAQLSQASEPSQAAQPAQLSQASQAAQPTQVAPSRYSADGLYNLANSYARAGKPGLAVLNYERAALLAPDDADINANLEYVRASAHVPTEPRNRFARVAEAASPSLAAWVGVLGIALLGAGLLLTKRIGRRFRWVRGGSILLGVALIALAVSNAMLLWPRMHEAVVLINQTPARVSPVPMGDTAFVLSEAETVTIRAEHEDFVLIRTRGGLTGWVARASLGAVVP
jgi:hypothetical protein